MHFQNRYFPEKEPGGNEKGKGEGNVPPDGLMKEKNRNDKGIYEKITQERLNDMAQAVSEGIRQGRAAEALATAIREAGELLREHFPIVDGDTNELPDAIMIGSNPDDD
jgi:hypothetical protein